MKFSFNILGYFGDLIAMRHEPEGVRVLSNLYWRILIITMLLIISLVFVYGIVGIFRVLEELSAATGVSTVPPPALDRNALDAVVDGFKKRQEQFNAPSGVGGSVSDPSR